MNNDLQATGRTELSYRNPATTSMLGYAIVKVRSLELKIPDIISPLLTGELIKDTKGDTVSVSLIDSCTKQIVKSGPEASGKVEIVVRDAPYDQKEKKNGEPSKFPGKLIRDVAGIKQDSGHYLLLDLIEGTATFPTVYFGRNHSRWLPQSRIRLEASFLSKCNCACVKEAQTEPFVVEDNRNDSKKHPIPSLNDHVWRLINVDKNGSLEKCLSNEKIKTVQNFIVKLFLDRQKLNKIFLDTGNADMFNATEGHAQKCPAILEYRSSDNQKTTVVFNVKGEVLQLCLEGQLHYENTLSEVHKQQAMNLVVSAFRDWENENTSKNVKQIISLNRERDLDIKESSLFGPGEDPNPERLPEYLRPRYNEISSGFEGCLKDEQEPSFR